jgi:hypothetical protein
VHLAARLGAQPFHRGVGPGQGGEDVFGLGGQRQPRLGEPDTATVRLGEHEPDLGAEDLQLLRDRGRGVGERCGHGGDRAAVGELAQHPQPLHVHGRIVRRPRPYGGRVRGWLRIVAGGVPAAAAIWLVALVVGPSGPTFALVSHLLAMAWISYAVAVRQPALTAGWFAVRSWEERAWHRAGTGPFRALLRAVGWERVITVQRRFDGSRAGLAELARQTRLSEFCHLVVAAASVAGMAVAAAFGDRSAVLWLGAATVAFHLYPVLLQRVLRARIVRLLTVKHN